MRTRDEWTGAALAAGSMLLVGGSVAASSLLSDFPLLGGQGVRYLAAALLLAGFARLRGVPLPRPSGVDWLWLLALAACGLAGLSVLLIAATRIVNPAGIGVVMGAAPLVLVLAGAVSGARRPTGRLLLAAVVVTSGTAVVQFGGGSGWTPLGLLLCLGALSGVVATSLLAAPVLPRLGPYALTVWSCGLAGAGSLVAGAGQQLFGGPAMLRLPTATELAALGYLAVAVTAVVFVAWFAAMDRLGVARAGLFNGLVPVSSLVAVALVGTGEVTALHLVGAGAVLAGVLLGLSGSDRGADLRRHPVSVLPAPARVAMAEAVVGGKSRR